MPVRKDCKRSRLNQKTPLRRELESYKKQGVELKLDGHVCSPKTICHACMIAEEGNYMRDYIRHKDGKIKEVDFHFIKKRK